MQVKLLKFQMMKAILNMTRKREKTWMIWILMLRRARKVRKRDPLHRKKQ
jgi:hypothetical protein